MTVLTLECDSGEKDLVSAELYSSGTIGIVEEETAGGRVRLRAYFEEAPQVAPGLEEYRPLLGQADPTDWVALSQSQWEPFPVGARFYLVPVWRDDPAPGGRLRLAIPPGNASGTGLHPATQLAIEVLERTVSKGALVLDIGTGSGILAAAALLLGAGRVIACDIDEEAARSARDYVLGGAVSVYAGSTRSLRAASVDLVAANLSRQGLTAAAREIARVLRVGGCAILSGFNSDRPPRLDGNALETLETVTRDGWSVWVARKAAGFG